MLRLDSPERLQAALQDQYVIERELGGGGMSRTYVAREAALDRRVVLKVLPPDLAATVSHERFRREILTIASLQHPNIVGILTTDEVEGLPFFTMPFVEGESLRLRLERHGPMTVAQTVSILRDVARALAYAHERGVVHRDIKPDNVLLSLGAAVVADFGVAKALFSARAAAGELTGEQVAVPRPSSAAPLRSGAITDAGMALGTPAYMAPEQAAGDPDADARADLYAFGVMAFEMLTGRTPFGPRAPAQLMAAHIAEPPPALAALCPAVPRALAELVMRCLEKDPARRPASAAVLAQALEDPAMVSGAFASATALPAASRAPRPPRLAPALVGAAILVAMGAWLASRLAGPGAPPPPPAVAAPATAPIGDPRAIAVLPFVNLSSDSADAYLAAGMTDDFAAALVRLGGLTVVSRSAALQAQARGATPEEIGRELGVGYLLEGTVQRQGTRIRVTTRLVEAATGVMHWAEVYDRDGADLFRVQDDLARAVVAAVREEVAPGTALAAVPAGATAVSTAATSTAAAPAAPTPPRVDPVAYDHYLRARAFAQRRDAGALAAAQREYERAIARDSGFARAWAGLAAVQAQVARSGGDVSAQRSAAVSGMASAERAIALDPRLAEGYAARGILELLRNDFVDAERDLAQALQLDAEDAAALQGLGELRLLRGDATGASDALRRAERADPQNPALSSVRVFARQLAGNVDSALATARRAAEASPTSMMPRWVLGTILLDAGRTREAIAELEAARRLAPQSATVLGTLGAAYALDGQEARAREQLTLLQRTPDAPRTSAASAKVLVGLGQRDSAFVLLFKAAAERDPTFATEPLTLHLWDALRDDPRFAQLVEQVGLRGERVVRRPPSGGRSSGGAPRPPGGDESPRPPRPVNPPGGEG
jgi:eukaryotic-like serine/threonine-protein kinase